MAGDILRETEAVKCPFYCGEDSSRIVCEGPETGLRVSLVAQQSRNRSKKSKYRQQYCCEDWKSCWIAMQLQKKYREAAEGG